MIVAFQILCIFGLIACGFYTRKRGIISAQGTTELSRLTTDLIYPALILTSVTQLSAGELSENLLLPLLVMAIAFTGLGLGLLALRVLRPMPPDTARAFLFHCLINNYLFLPLPLVLFLYNERGVALLVFSSIGYELVLWTLGVILFTRGTTILQRLRQMISPPFVALVLGLVWVLLRDGLGWEPQGILAPVRDALFFVTKTLGQALVTFAVLVAGSRFAVLKPRTMLGGRLWLVSGIRLLLVPLIMLPLLQLIPLEPVARGILFIVAVMPSAMVSVLFSERYGGDSEFIAGALLLTHLGALVTVPVFLALYL